MPLVDAAIMYCSAIEKDRAAWHRTTIIAQAMGAEMKLSDIYSNPFASHPKDRVDKRTQMQRHNTGFSDWITRRN